MPTIPSLLTRRSSWLLFVQREALEIFFCFPVSRPLLSFFEFFRPHCKDVVTVLFFSLLTPPSL